MATALFYNIPAHGHTNPSLPLVAELVRRGERIVYYNSESFRAAVERTGAEFRNYGAEYEFAPGQDSATPFKAMVLILGVAESLLPQLMAEARELKPDYVIYDSMCPWGKQVAQSLNVPAICSCSIMFAGRANMKALPRDMIPPLELLRNLPTVARSVWQYRSVAQRLQRRVGVDSPAVPDFFGNPGDLTLVYTSRLFQIGAEHLNGDFRFVGPSIDARPDHTDFPWEWLEGEPVIYVSLGTLFNERADFFRACLAAFGGLSYRVVMSIGKKIPPESLGPIPANVLVRAHNPQLALLERAALFITHGGMNSASESLWFGVPMLVVPQAGDQRFIARQVEKLGAGLLVDPRRFTPASLREQAERVLGEVAFRQRSRVLGDSLREAGGYRRAADEVLVFTRR